MLIIVLDVFCLGLAVVLIGFMAITLDSAFGGEDFTSSKQQAALVSQIAIEQGRRPLVFYDLGSGRGAFASRLAKLLPWMKVEGMDNNWFRVFCATLRSVFVKNVHFSRQDIFSADLSNADIIYIYLPHEMMAKLENKLNTGLKNGALIITHSVSFPNQAPLKILENKLFIYQNVHAKI